MSKSTRNKETILRILEDTLEIQKQIENDNFSKHAAVTDTDIFNGLLQLELKHLDMDREEYNKLVKSLTIEEGQALISEIVAEDFHNWNNTKNKGIDTIRDVQKFLEDVFDIDRRRALEILDDHHHNQIDEI